MTARRDGAAARRKATADWTEAVGCRRNCPVPAVWPRRALRWRAAAPDCWYASTAPASAGCRRYWRRCRRCCYPRAGSLWRRAAARCPRWCPVRPVRTFATNASHRPPLRRHLVWRMPFGLSMAYLCFYSNLGSPSSQSQEVSYLFFSRHGKACDLF